MNTNVLCPLCGEGHVSAHQETVETEYKGHKGVVAQFFKLCDHCGSDFAGATELKLSKRALLAWRKQVDGFLTGAEIASLRAKLKITQAQAAKLFGGGPVAFSKYENDDVCQSESMDTLLRLVLRSREAFWALVAEKGLDGELRRAPISLKRVDTAIFEIERTQQEPSPYYDPKQFRRIGTAEWKQR